MPHPILLYDGVCGLCNRMVQFILRRDAAGVFRFASLQSSLAGQILARHGADAAELDTVYVVVNYGLVDEEILSRSDAVLFMLRHLGAAELRSAHPGSFDCAQDGLRPGSTHTEARPGPTEAKATADSTGVLKPGLTRWRIAAWLLQVLPRRLRDFGYRVVARNRYRVFGRYDTCPMPTDQTRSRFLDM